MIDELIANLEKKKTAHVEAYGELVGKLARNRKVKADDVESVLAAAGKSPAELKRDCESMVERIALAERITHERDLERERCELSQQIAAADAELAAAEEAHREKVLPLGGRVHQITHELREIERARDELRRTAPKCIRDEVAAIDSESRKAAEAMKEVDRRIEIIAKNVRELQEALKDSEWRPFQVEYGDRLKKQEARLHELQAERAALVKQLHEDLAEKRAAAHKAMLTP